MIKSKVLIPSIIIGILMLLALFINVQLTFIDASFSNTRSPEEAFKQNILIRTLNPSIREVPFGEETTLVIDNAWSEKYFMRKNYGFWAAKILHPDKYLLKISFLLKDKKTGSITKPINPVLLESTSSANPFTIGWGNVQGILMNGESMTSFTLDLRLRDDRVETIEFN